jgi:hypothetical protein
VLFSSSRSWADGEVLAAEAYAWVLAGIDASEAARRLTEVARHSGRPLAEVARSLLRRLAVDP